MFDIIKDIVEKIMLPVVLMMGPLIFAYKENSKLKTRVDNLKVTVIDLEETVKDHSLGLEMDLILLNSIQEIASDILIRTKAERFLILTATNGTRDLRFANAIYEHHDTNPKINLSVGATGKYFRFEFDSPYKEMLKYVERYGWIKYNTETMEESDLKSIYKTESIKYANVFFLMRYKIDDQNDRMFYCSIATHQNEKYTSEEDVIMRTLLGKLRLKMQNLIH